MNWKEWVVWKEKKYIAVVLFIILYIVTIPWRGYEFLSGFVDISQGVPIWAHLTLTVFGLIVLLILLKMVEWVVKRVLERKK